MGVLGGCKKEIGRGERGEKTCSIGMEADWKGGAAMAPQTMRNGGDQVEGEVRMRMHARAPPRGIKKWLCIA